MTPQMIPDSVPAPPPMPQPLSEMARLTGVFFSPKATFPDVALRPRWWIPVILLAIMSMLVANVYGRRVGWEKMIRAQIERNPRMEQLTPAQREQNIAVGTRVAGIVGYVSPVFVVVMVLVVSAVLIFVFNTMMSANLGFPSMMGIVSYSFLPGLISSALTLLVMFLKDPEDFDLQRPLAFNLGAFLPDSAPRWAIQLGTSFDMFSFWIMALIAIGVSSCVKKIGFGKAFTAVLLPWAIVVILRTMALIAFGG
jgi:Yip1 domain